MTQSDEQKAEERKNERRVAVVQAVLMTAMFNTDGPAESFRALLAATRVIASLVPDAERDAIMNELESGEMVRSLYETVEKQQRSASGPSQEQEAELLAKLGKPSGMTH